MADPYIGQISIFGFPFAPRFWAACDGSNLPINQYSSLFALVGTLFGGNGTSQFGLPNLGGATPCGAGAGPGLTPRSLGRAFGTATVTLDGTTMPSHSHGGQAGPFSRTTPAVGMPTALSALTTANGADIYSDGPPDTVMATGAISPTGGGGAHNNLQPYLAVNYCMALLGQFPDFS